MAILITGGAGYIGSVTVDLLRERGEQVVVLDNLTRGHRAAVPQGVPFYEGDIGDSDLLRRIAGEHNIEACIHFAALAYVGESVTNPSLYFDNNVARRMGAAVAVAWCPAGGIFVDLCYLRRAAFRSTRLTQQPTNHTAGQAFMERIMRTYHGLRSEVVALRYFNAARQQSMADHQPETHLIPLVLQAAERDSTRFRLW